MCVPHHSNYKIVCRCVYPTKRHFVDVCTPTQTGKKCADVCTLPKGILQMCVPPPQTKKCADVCTPRQKNVQMCAPPRSEQKNVQMWVCPTQYKKCAATQPSNQPQPRLCVCAFMRLCPGLPAQLPAAVHTWCRFECSGRLHGCVGMVGML